MGVVLRNLEGVNRNEDVRLLLIPVRLPWKKLGGDALVYRDVAANEDDEDVVVGFDCNQSFTSGLLLINELMDGVTDSIVDASSRYDSETFVPTDASLDIRFVDADVVLNFDVGGASLDILLSLHDVVDMDDCKLTDDDAVRGGGGLAASKLALCREIALLIALPSEDMYSSSSLSSSQL